MQRNNEEYILMTIAFGGVIAITPFALIRFLSGDWLIGFVDLAMVVGMLIMGILSYYSYRVDLVAIALSVLGLAGMVLAISIKGADLLYWAYPTMIAVFFVLRPRMAILMTIVASLCIATVIMAELALTKFIAVMMTLIVNNVFAYVFSRRMNTQQEQLNLLVRKDPLTGTGNRLALDEKMFELIEMNKRNNQPFSVVMIDADRFKSINDQYGHAVGDQVLISLVQLLVKRIRSTDNMFRYGGEEFVVLLVGAELQFAKNIAEELRLLIESATILQGHSVTVSQGVAEFNGTETAEECLNRADKALYCAKDAGRNRTMVAA